MKAIRVEDLADDEFFYAAYPVLRAVDAAAHHPSFDYQPDSHAKRDQEAFHRSAKTFRVVLGGNQSGKTRCESFEAKYWLEGQHPYQTIPPGPKKVWFISAQYENLQQGIWEDLEEILLPWKVKRLGPVVKGYRVPKFIEMVDGSVGEFFSGFSSQATRRKVATAEINIVFIDEEVEDDIIGELIPRLIRRDGRMVIGATAWETKDYIADFEERAESGDPDVDLFRFSTRRARDVGHASGKIVGQMERMYSGEDLAIRLEGETRRRFGLVYPEWSGQNVIADIDLPMDWARYMAIDPGWETCALLWLAVSPDGRLYFYRERYLHAKRTDEVVDEIRRAEGWIENPSWEPFEWKRATPDEVLDAMVLGQEASVRDRVYDFRGYEDKWLFDEKESERIEFRLIDPKNFGTNPGGSPMFGSSLVAFFNMPVVPANNELEYGIDVSRRVIATRDLQGAPVVYAFRSLQHFLRERAGYRRRVSREGQKSHGKPQTKSDHLMDCMRYLITAHPRPRAEAYDRRRRPTDDDLVRVGNVGYERPPEHHSGLGVTY